jgi:hypothetical protein
MAEYACGFLVLHYSRSSRFDSPGGSMIAEPQLRAFLESFPAFGGTLPAHGAIHFLLNSQDTSLWR